MSYLRIFFILMPIIFMGCISGPGQKSVENEANRFFAALQSADYAQVMGRYDSQFFANQDEQSWEQGLRELVDTLGAVSRVELRKVQTDTRYSGRFYILEYSVYYGETPTWHTVTLLNPNNSEEVLLIGHKFRVLKL